MIIIRGAYTEIGTLEGIISEMMRKPTSLATALIMLALLFAVVPLMPQLAGANPDPWWDTDWQYRMLINITENSGSTLTNYQVPITIDTATFNYSKADASGDDIRFATDGTECDYWIETWNTGGTSTIWVEVPSLTASSTTTIYMYYGNSVAGAASSESAVFDYVDRGDQTSSWTLAGSSGQNATEGNPSPGYYAASSSGSYMYRNINLAPQRIVTFNIKSDGLGNLFFLVNSTGAGQMYRLDTRGGTDYAGFAATANWTFWNAPASGFNAAADAWYKLTIVITSSASATFYYEQTTSSSPSGFGTQLGTYAITNNGGYIGLVGDALGAAYTTWWDNIIVRKYASPEPTVNLGQEESSTSWTDYFGGTAAISSLANITVSGGDVVLDTTSLTQGLDPADFNREYTFNHDNPAQEMSGFTLSQAIDSVDELQIYVVTAAAGYNAKIALYGPKTTPPSGASLRMYTVSFNLGSTGWVGAALDSGSPQTSLPAGNYWFAVIEDDYAHSTATTMRDTTCTAGYNGCSWYRTTMFTWPNFPSTLPSLTHSSSGYYGVYRITYSRYNTLGNLTSTAITPEIPGSWGNFTASHNLPTGTDISYKILKASDDSPLCTVTAAQAAAGYNISSCAGSNSSIKLYAELSTTGSNTPTLHDWKVTWSTNTLPTVGEPVVTSPMTPQSQAWVNVTITDNNKLSDISNVTTVLFYDADGSYTDPGASPDPDTQTLAIMTWYASNDTFTIQSGSPSTWSINNTTSTHPVLTGTTGDWKFSFQPGKVATETVAPAKWFAKVTATDKASASGSNNNSATGSTMNFYGEINVNTATVDFGTVARGSAFADNAETADVANIANGNYTENAKTDNGTTGVAHWDNTGATVALNTTGTPGVGEFSLAVDDTITLASSVNMTTDYQAINSAGVQTSEDGYPSGDHGLWLAMGPAGIPAGVYNGTIYFQIANRA